LATSQGTKGVASEHVLPLSQTDSGFSEGWLLERSVTNLSVVQPVGWPPSATRLKWSAQEEAVENLCQHKPISISEQFHVGGNHTKQKPKKVRFLACG
jgi:hypothetical protein